MAKKFARPKDVKVFWEAPHCGPGTLDPKEVCGFCGSEKGVCARNTSDSIRHKDGEMVCGGSGYWCYGCGRFWANDSCGETFGTEMKSADGARMTEKDGRVVCVCGTLLAKFESEEG